MGRRPVAGGRRLRRRRRAPDPAGGAGAGPGVPARSAAVPAHGDDARLCVEGEHRAQPLSWRVIYSADDWPLQRILRSLLGWREFDGRLQASGWAEKAPGKDWVGGTTLLVHEPVINVPRNKFRVERVRLGSSRFDLLAEPATIRATLDIDVDESTQIQGEALVDSPHGRPAQVAAERPDQGHVRGDQGAAAARARNRPRGRPARRQRRARRHRGRADVQRRLPRFATRCSSCIAPTSR